MVKKIKVYKNFKINHSDRKSIILIGNFDGLHIGHQKLFNFAKLYKSKKKLKIGVITFDPIPKMYFNSSFKNYRISNFSEKLNFLKKFNVDFVINKKFNRKFSKTDYLDFIKKILSKKLQAKYIFVSDNFRFGYKRKGNVKLLKYFEKKYNYKVVNPRPLKKKKLIISSTLIRKLIQKGNIELANKFLNRNWAIEGKVKIGRKIGRKIGFPTCNLDLKDYVIAQPGVYAVKIKIGSNKKTFKGVANIGYRPTFNQNKILLEVNLFNFFKNIYYKDIKVEFINFIRKEKKFKNISELKKQIKKDVDKTKKILK